MANDPTKHGVFCWNELVTKDLVKAKEFYSNLLGWSMLDAGPEMGGYNLIKNDGEDNGGMMQITKEMGDIPSHWMSYVTVDNVDESAKKVTELGGQIIVPPTDIPTVGRFTVISDPIGAAISLITLTPKQ